VTLDAAVIQIKAIVRHLYAQDRASVPKVFHSEANKELLRRYWATEYQHRDLVDVKSARNDFERALAAIGKFSLIAATKEQLQGAVAKFAKGNKQRRLVERLNTLLKFCSRDFKLHKDRPVRHLVKFVTLADFKILAAQISDKPTRLLVEAAFYTGCRAGELFALNDMSLRGTVRLQVLRQVDRDGLLRETKTRRYREVNIIMVGVESVKKWCAFKDKQGLRHLKLSKIVARACKAAGLPVITFHDLRHSYAIHCFSKGLKLKDVADSLGNSVTVCEQHYLGYLPFDDGIDVAKLLASE